MGCSPWGHKESDTTEWLNTAHPGILGFQLGLSDSVQGSTSSPRMSSLRRLHKEPPSLGAEQALGFVT